MTPRRWQLLGGYVMGGLLVLGVNILAPNPLSWQAIVIAIGAGAIGIGAGQWIVQEWQEAGRR